MGILLIILCIIAITLGLYILLLRKDIKQLNDQMESRAMISLRGDIKSISHNKQINKLVKNYNQLLFAYKETEASHQRKTQALKNMVSSIAHDFRTPITAMSGYIQLIKEQDDETKMIERLNIVEERIKILNQNVEDFYYLSLIESNELPLNTELIDVIGLTQDIIALFYNEIVAVYPEININLEGHFETLIDKHHYTHVLSNIIKNALIHGERFLDIKVQIEDQCVISFRNGMHEGDDPDMNRIFERSYRGEKSRSVHSTGLGLSLAKSLMENMNGTINAFQDEDRITFDIIIK